MRVIGPWRLPTPKPCTSCKLDNVAFVLSDVETIRCRNCGADRDGYVWLDTASPCRRCFQTKRVVAWENGDQILSRCSACTLDRGCLDHLTYGAHFGRHVTDPGRRRARERPTTSARDIAARVSSGECVHDLLRSIGVIPKFIEIPDRFFSEAPVRQLSLESLAGRSDDEHFAVVWTDEIARHEHDDHILGLALHDRLARSLTDEQSRRMRVAWIVPSCADCNYRRSKRLEDVAYLVSVFSLYLRAAGLDAHEEAEEVRMFVDAAKLAHVHLRLEAEYRRRANLR